MVFGSSWLGKIDCSVGTFIVGSNDAVEEQLIVAIDKRFLKRAVQTLEVGVNPRDTG